MNEKEELPIDPESIPEPALPPDPRIQRLMAMMQHVGRHVTGARNHLRHNRLRKDSGKRSPKFQRQKPAQMTISVADVYRDYAGRLGVPVDALTNVQKQQAMFCATIDAMKPKRKVSRPFVNHVRRYRDIRRSMRKGSGHVS